MGMKRPLYGSGLDLGLVDCTGRLLDSARGLAEAGVISTTSSSEDDSSAVSSLSSSSSELERIIVAGVRVFGLDGGVGSSNYISWLFSVPRAFHDTLTRLIASGTFEDDACVWWPARSGYMLGSFMSDCRLHFVRNRLQ